MKKIALLLVLFCSLNASAIFSQAGLLDVTFGNQGKVLTSLAGFSEKSFAYDMLVLPSGKIVLIGQTYNNPTTQAHDYFMAQIDQDGSLDQTFGDAGKVVMDYGGDFEAFLSIGVQSDGKLVVGGVNYLYRFHPNGSIDSTFGNEGRVDIYLQLWSPVLPKALLVQSDDKILIGGNTNVDGSVRQFAIARFDTNGAVDSTFGTNGYTTTLFNTFDNRIEKMVLQPDGKITATGWSIQYGTNDRNIAIARYTTNGQLDSTFGNAGKIIYTYNQNSEDYARSIAIQNDGKIIIGGELIYQYACLLRYNVDGTLDSTFGVNGLVLVTFNGFDRAFLSEVVVQPDGKIVTGGGASIYQSSVSPGFTVMRFNPDGSKDLSFGTNGQSACKFTSSSTDQVYSIGLQPDGKIVLGGSSQQAGVYASMALVRFLTDLNVGVIDFREENTLLVYPNPISQSASLQYSTNTEETITIQLFDVQGALVKTLLPPELQPVGSHVLPLVFPGDLLPGNYVLAIISPNGLRCIQIAKL